MDFLKLRATLGLDDSEYQSGLSNASNMAGKIGGKIAKGLGIAVTAATGAMTAFGKSAIDAGMTFDSSMSQVAATMGKTMDEMQNEVGSVDLAWGHFSGNLRDYAQEMGRNTAFSATEAADALNYMALAGYDTQTSMEMLPNVLNLAAAGNMELARASDMVTDTQTAFGLSLERTSQMVDEMAKAASTGNTNVEQLGDAFLVVGGLAQELNGGMVTLADGTQKPVDGLQELEIALTAMANAGIKGGEAGTHMRNMLLKLSDPTDDGVAALERMGVTIFNTEGEMRSLADIFGDLSTEMEKLSQEEKISTITDLFNARDTASAEALLKAIGQDWDKIGASILDAEGAAQKMANTQLDNLAGDITLFKSALEGAKIAVSDGLTPALREFVQFGTDGLSKITSAFKEGGVTGAMEEFGNILSEGLNMIIEKLPDFIDAGMKLLGALGQGILDNLDVISDSAEAILLKLIGGLIMALPKLTEASLRILTSLGQFMAEQIPNMIPSIIVLLTGIGQAIIDNLPLILDAAAQIVLSLAEGLITFLPEMIPAITEMILNIVEMLTEPDRLVEIINAAVLLIGALAEGLINALPILIERLPFIVLNIIETLARLAPQLIMSGIQIIVQLVFGIVSAIPRIISTFMEIKDHIFERLGEIKDGAKTWGSDMIDNFINGIKEKWEDLKASLKETAETIKSYLGFSEPEEGPLSNFHTYAPDMMQLFAKGITDNTDLITDAINRSFDIEPLIKANYNNDDNNNPANVQGGAQPVPVTVVLQGDAGKFFTAMIRENDVYTKANGKSAFA